MPRRSNTYCVDIGRRQSECTRRLLPAAAGTDPVPITFSSFRDTDSKPSVCPVVSSLHVTMAGLQNAHSASVLAAAAPPATEDRQRRVLETTADTLGISV
jgi:hypothetical protein